ncbi:SAM-dependent methyltransferase [Lipingzhangella halophila]|nr:SAM-dependent methyltransferase [Lipingzhangella halophila]
MKHSASNPSRIPPEIDLSVPSVARAYDAMLGGKDNFEVDREATVILEETNPGTIALARANRAYLSRGVEHVANAGVRQFLDLGSGLPAAENTHEIAQRTHPDARVVYVDNDPIVLAHGRAILADNPYTSVATADLTNVGEVLESEDTQRLIDFSEPVCLMLVSLLHCIPDEQDPFGTAQAYLDRLAPGSWLVYSHIVSDDEAAARTFTERIHAFGTPWGRVRTPEEAATVFDSLELASPSSDGTFPAVPVECSTWRNGDKAPETRPADPETRIWEHSGVAVKR